MKAVLAGLLLAVSLAAPGAALAQDKPGSVKAGALKAGPGKPARQAARPVIVQDYTPDPAIWLLRDDDTKIYLFGTFHILPQDFRWRSARFDDVVSEAGELIVETTDSDQPTAEDPVLNGLLTSLESRPRVSERLSPENGPKWRALGKRLGMPPDYFDRLPPLLAVFGMAMGTITEGTGANYRYGVETVLEEEFRSAGKPIGSIENGADVLASLLSIDEDLLIADLDKDLSLWDGHSLDSWFEALASEGGVTASATSPLAQEHAWAQGQEMDVRDELFGETAFSGFMGKLLLDDRNRAWAGWLERRLDTPGTVLVAVGAAHLAGENSVQDMLSERGLAAERLN